MISRIALFICFFIGITCVTSQQATIQSQLSTNQTVALTYNCKFPYATATDDQGVVYSSCAQNNASQGIIWTYRDNQGVLQSGWVTSQGNGSCLQSWGISVSRDGNYLFATCSGNPSDRQVMGYEKQLNGSTWIWNYIALNTSTWVCGRDIIFDDMTEDVYALCGVSFNSANQRIIKFSHNATTDSYDIMSQDLGITANYIKYNSQNNYLYWANTTSLGFLVIHDDNGTSIQRPTNNTIIQVNGTLTNWCEITSFTWLRNSSNTLFVGCTGFHNLATAYTSYSVLRIDMNQTITTINVTTTNITSTDNTTLSNATTTPPQTIVTWNFTATNVTWTDSKLSGADGNADLTYPADGSCKAPSDMETDSMNQLYVACMQNAPTRSVIRYTQINSTYYLPAYVTSPTECNHPLTNSLTINMHDDVLVSCSVNNWGLLFTTLTTNITITPTSAPTNNITNTSSSSSGLSTGTGTNITSTGPTSTPTIIIIPSGSGSSSGPTTTPGTGSSSSTCIGGICIPTNISSSSSTGRGSSSSSSTGAIGGNTSSKLNVDIAGFILATILLLVSM